MGIEKYDIIIIGCGIIGASVARFLSEYKLSVLIIEKEYDVGCGASSHNSAIIHSGHDPIPGTLKSSLNIRGNRLWEKLALELGVPFKKSGSYVVALNDEEDAAVKKLYERAIANGVPEIEIFKTAEILYREPKINSEVKSALWTPTTAVIDPFEATLACAENAVSNGVQLMLNTLFVDFIFDKNIIKGVVTDKGEYFSGTVINAAGLFSDQVMHKAGVHSDFKVVPTRGEYFIFDAAKFSLNTVLYPTPTEKGKGTLVSTTTHGNVMIGPNADKIEDKEDFSTTTSGLENIVQNAKKLVPSLEVKDVIAQFAGLRAKGNDGYKDFIIEKPKEVEGFINLGAIDSPGLASAPSIALFVVDILKKEGVLREKKENWNPERIPRVSFKKLSHAERMEFVNKNPKYGKVICRCEEVTEGEILDAIHSVIPARTYDSIKRRTWMGTGRCQGSFDYHRVIEILARELNIPETEVTKKGKGSEFLLSRTK